MQKYFPSRDVNVAKEIHKKLSEPRIQYTFIMEITENTRTRIKLIVPIMVYEIKIRNKIK